MLLAVINDQFDITIEKALQNVYEITRQFQRSELPIAVNRLQMTEDKRLKNQETLQLSYQSLSQFSQKPDKRALIDIYVNYFKRNYIETNKCTWRLLYRSGSWIFFEKLRQT